MPQPLKGRKIMVVADEDVAKLWPAAPAFTWIYDITDEHCPMPIATFQVEGLDKDGAPQPPMMGCHQPSERFKGTVIPFAWFAQGLRLLDIADPFAPEEVGFYEPDAPPGAELSSSNDVTIDDRGICLPDRPHQRGVDIIETIGVCEETDDHGGKTWPTTTHHRRSARRTRTCRSIRRCARATSSSSRARCAKDENGNMCSGTIEVETRWTLEAISRILAEDGADLADVVKVTTYLEDARDFGRYNSVFAEYFPEGRLCPHDGRGARGDRHQDRNGCFAYKPKLGRDKRRPSRPTGRRLTC